MWGNIKSVLFGLGVFKNTKIFFLSLGDLVKNGKKFLRTVGSLV